jgi:quinol monooxygenase YgiN
MVSRGLLVRLEAKPGKENEIEELFRSALPGIREERGTTEWFAIRLGRGDYGLVDVFPDDAARDAHLSGAVAAALFAKAPELFAKAPDIKKLDVIAFKLPSGAIEPVTKGLLLTFRAKAGHEADVEQFLKDAKALVDAEPKTTAWFAIHLEDGMYGIFDVFPDNGGRFSHLTGHVPRELAKHALTLLGSVPDTELPEVIAAKLA